MKALLLGACLAAVLGAPALAQPYDRYDQPGYQDQRDPYYDQDRTQDPYDRDYQDDRSYDNDRYDNDRTYDNDRYDRDRGYDEDRGYGGYHRDYDDSGVPAGAHYTGRTGASWRNDEGQSCTWREMSWQDAAGSAAYKWVASCR
jgi:hypothetical protein